MIANLGIADTKKIITAIADVYAIDFKDMALTSFKRRLIKIINKSNFLFIDDFIKELSQNSDFFETCLSDIFVDTTEMFRDPSMWRELKDIYLPGLIRKYNNINIHIPEISSGEDVYSLIILLKECNWIDKTNILVSSMSQKRLDKLQAGAIYDSKKMETNEANFIRVSAAFNLSKYYTNQAGQYAMDKTLLSGVTFKNFSYLKDTDNITEQHLVLCRNRLIYYNVTLQDKIVDKLINSLAIDGCLCCGNKENIDNSFFASKLQCVNLAEKIYLRKI